MLLGTAYRVSNISIPETVIKLRRDCQKRREYARPEFHNHLVGKLYIQVSIRHTAYDLTLWSEAALDDLDFAEFLRAVIGSRTRHVLGRR